MADVLDRWQRFKEAPHSSRFIELEGLAQDMADDIERLREDTADDMQANNALRDQRNQLLNALNRLLNVTQVHCMKLPESYESHAAWEDAKQVVWEIERG